MLTINQVVATIPQQTAERVGISSALPKLGVKTRAEWLRKLAEAEDIDELRRIAARQLYAATYSPPSKLYKPTHGGYPDASRNLPRHRCSRDDGGVSGD